MKTKYISAAVWLLTSLGISAASEAKPFKSFSKAKRAAVGIYSGSEKTFYCNCPYKIVVKKSEVDSSACGYRPRISITKNGKVNRRSKRIEWEHVMPAWKFGHQRDCWKRGGRKACRNDDEFSRMEADLHNLVPAIGELNGDRSNFKMGLIIGEPRAYGRCNFEVDFKSKTVEPDEDIRGDIARIYFYMRDQYQIDLNMQQTLLFKAWNKADPVSAWEIERDKRIHNIQGNGNPYIYSPSMRQPSLESKPLLGGKSILIQPKRKKNLY